MRYNVIEFADRALFELPVAVIDFETTGVNPQECRAVEVAIVHLNLGRGNAELVYSERINPGVAIPEGASDVHGIYDSDVEGCRTFEEMWEDISGLLQGRVLAAYNLSFDWLLLNCEYRRSSLWHPTAQEGNLYGSQFFGLCGLVLSRSLDDHLRGAGSHRLGMVCDRWGVELSDAHNASADALATAHLLEVLLREASDREGRFPTFRDFWGWQKSCAILQERGLRDWLRKKGVENAYWPWTDY